MCNAATRSSRASLILDPYPSIVDPQNSQRLAMDPAVSGKLPYSAFFKKFQNKNFELVLAVLKAIITGREELLVRGRVLNQCYKFVQFLEREMFLSEFEKCFGWISYSCISSDAVVC